MTVQELIDILSEVEDKSKKIVIMRYGELRHMNEICNYIESKSYVRLIEADGDVEVELL